MQDFLKILVDVQSRALMTSSKSFILYLWFFPSQSSKLVYNSESLSPKPMQCNGVLYLTVLTPEFQFGILKSCYLFCLITYSNMQEVD